MKMYTYGFDSYGVIGNGAVGSKSLPARGTRLSDGHSWLEDFEQPTQAVALFITR